MLRAPTGPDHKLFSACIASEGMPSHNGHLSLCENRWNNRVWRFRSAMLVSREVRLDTLEAIRVVICPHVLVSSVIYPQSCASSGSSFKTPARLESPGGFQDGEKNTSSSTTPSRPAKPRQRCCFWWLWIECALAPPPSMHSKYSTYSGLRRFVLFFFNKKSDDPDWLDGFTQKKKKPGETGIPVFRTQPFPHTYIMAFFGRSERQAGC